MRYPSFFGDKIDGYRYAPPILRAVYYEMEDEIVKVVAVLDMRRNPAWIREKLEQN